MSRGERSVDEQSCCPRGQAVAAEPMICAACQHENPADNAFCGACGARLALVCGGCGNQNGPQQSFCGKCGQRLRDASASPRPSRPAPAKVAAQELGERRQLTVLFCDLVGSTELASRLDAEEYREVVGQYHGRAGEVIGRYGGYVAQHLGDGLLVYFGWPQTRDDEAERAVRAGLALIDAARTITAGDAPLAVRVGLHTGSVVVSDIGSGARKETLAVGNTPTIAARVQAVANPGEVLLTAATHQLVSGLFLVEGRGAEQLKGIAEPIALYRAVQPSGVRGRLAAAAAARGLTPFVGREAERQLLRSRFEQACESEGQMVLLIGEAGIGKSRLAQVLHEDLAGTPHTWLETGGTPYFATTPFHPIIELLKQFFAWDAASIAIASRQMRLRRRASGVFPIPVRLCSMEKRRSNALRPVW